MISENYDAIYSYLFFCFQMNKMYRLVQKRPVQKINSTTMNFLVHNI